MKKTRNIISVCIVLLAGLLVSGCYDENDIKTELLKEVLIGSSIDDVKIYCGRRKLICHENLNVGYLDQRTNQVVGSTSMWVFLPERRTGLLEVTSGTIYFGFDKSGTLIDVWVWIVRDGP
ncbi:MAG: hypothetical protein V4857_10220 [Pseudomonadota bacterium]